MRRQGLRRCFCVDTRSIAVLIGFLVLPAMAREAGEDQSAAHFAELDPGTAIPANEAVMDPLRVPEDDAEHPRVERILERRARSEAGPADEAYPLVPGCEPVSGETGKLPVADRTHHLGSRGLCLPAQWVDSFFADTDADFYAARTLIRIVGTSQWQENVDDLTDVRVDARVALPHTENRLSLILRSDDQEDDRLQQRDAILEEEEEDEVGAFRAALRWAAYRTRRATARLDAGVRGSNPYVPFVRTRYRYRQPLPWDMQARANQEFYWRDNEDRRGLASELQLERPLTTNTVTRLTASVESNTRMRDENLEALWSQSASWFWRIKRRAALQASLSVRGRTEPGVRADSRRFSVRLRHSVWRPWLYFEVEPYAVAQRTDDFKPRPGIALRLETQLGDYQ